MEGCEANQDRHSRGELEGRVTLHVQSFSHEPIFGGVDGGKHNRKNMAHNSIMILKTVAFCRCVTTDLLLDVADNCFFKIGKATTARKRIIVVKPFEAKHIVCSTS